MHLTQYQYGLLVTLSQSIPRVLAGVPEGFAQASESSVLDRSSAIEKSLVSIPHVELQPELRTIQSVEAPRPWPTIDLVVTVNTVKLHLYDEFAITDADLKDHGIARFALNHNSLRIKILSDGAMEAEVIFKSLTMNNTRPGNSRFREIVPAVTHERNQVMLLFTRSGANGGSTMAILTVDSPKVIFSVDPIITLMKFFTSAFSPQATSVQSDGHLDNRSDITEQDSQNSRLDFRLDLHDVSISVLEDDSDSESQAVRLTVKQVLLSQQVG